ncbi:MAG: SEC-C domain-containing protein [Desulfatiglandales bacterium]
MKNVGRNDPCPCGSGKKFKKCHLGREEELSFDGSSGFTEEMSRMITSLPEVNYGRCREMVDALDIPELTSERVGVRFVDLRTYRGLGFYGTGGGGATEEKGGSIFINLEKTRMTDPDHIYLAVSRDIDDSSLAHQLAHVLDYLGGSRLMPGLQSPLSYELDVPVEHLEHPEEFGRWLRHLKGRFDIQLDADDAIVDFLYENGRLIKGELIQRKDGPSIRTRSNGILAFLTEHQEEVDALIMDLPGYIGSRGGDSSG